jgi:hypothetical protein
MNINLKILGTMFLAIASITGVVSIGNHNSGQVALADISDLGCLAGCIVSFCPATVGGETSGASAGDFNSEGTITGNNTNVYPTVGGASQASSYSCQIGDTTTGDTTYYPIP